MRKTKRVLALLAVAVMCLCMFAGCGEEVVKNENKVILGNITELTGDFRWPGFTGSSAGAADQDINRLTAGYSTMKTNQNGAYVWNKTVVKEHSEVEDDNGNLVVTIEINPGLKFSDGTEVKAVNYLAYVLAFSTKVVVNANATGKAGQAFVGFASYNAYVGSDVAVDGATKEFAGVRLLGDYKFSLTIDAAAGYYPYYYANTYGAVSAYPVELCLGEGVEIKDDGNGAYLSDSWYEKADDSTAEALTYKKTAHIEEARYDVTKYPYSGAYTIQEWDSSTKEVTLKLNPNFAGNFEGQKPSITTVVYVKLVEETQLDQLKTGVVDVLANITGGVETKAALDAKDASEGKFKENHYQRAGYGKIQFECDFGPTMFTEVRQAVAYLLDRNEFCTTFTGGYGVVVNGPYSPDFSMWSAVKDTIELNNYEYSLASAKKVLEEGGWVYNSKGETYVEGAIGADAVRYKKLTAEEAAACDGVNKTYASVANTDGVEYKTVEINGEYYMPLAINWFGSTPNTVTDLLGTSLANSSDLASAGMVIRATTGDFTKLLGEIYREESYGYGGTPTYGMFNLATGWNSSVYDYSYNWSSDPAWFAYSTNKYFDPDDALFPYYAEDGSHTKLSYDEALKAAKDAGASDLGMDYLSMAMVYDATTEEEYNQWWKAYIEKWNYLQPDIPLYSNYYYDVYNSKIENYKTGPFWGCADAIVYATIANAVEADELAK